MCSDVLASLRGGAVIEIVGRTAARIWTEVRRPLEEHLLAIGIQMFTLIGALANMAVIAFRMSKKAEAAPPAPAAEKKGHASTRTGGRRTLVVRDVIREVAGWSPYEKRAQDLIKLDKTKAARAYLKKRLGSYDRARRKQLYLEEIIREEARQHEAHHVHHEAK
jgi:large subunit ribosomal protein L36e